MSKKNILILATGGTIASSASDEGLIPSLNILNIIQYLSGIVENYTVTARDILCLDSSNIQPEEWVIISNNIYESYKDYDGIIVTHGTDTMAYTSSVLSFMLHNIPIPVVITGSQLPASNPLTDAIENLRCAFAMAGSSVPGIYVAFNRKIMLGCRAVKVRTTGFDAFESVNYPYVATIDSNGLTINTSIIPTISSDFILKNQISTDVFLIKLTPGLNPQIFDKLLELNYKGIIIEAFGTGGLHFIHRDLITQLEKLTEQGIAVVVSSQCLYERSDFSIYQTGKKILEKGVIQTFDMTTEAVVTKLMWALGQTSNIAKIKDIFATNFSGEITLQVH